MITMEKISLDNPSLGKVRRLDVNFAADKLLADNGFNSAGLSKDYKSESIKARTNMMRALYSVPAGIILGIALGIIL